MNFDYETASWLKRHDRGERYRRNALLIVFITFMSTIGTVVYELREEYQLQQYQQSHPLRDPRDVGQHKR